MPVSTNMRRSAKQAHTSPNFDTPDHPDRGSCGIQGMCSCGLQNKIHAGSMSSSFGFQSKRPTPAILISKLQDPSSRSMLSSAVRNGKIIWSYGSILTRWGWDTTI